MQKKPHYKWQGRNLITNHTTCNGRNYSMKSLVMQSNVKEGIYAISEIVSEYVSVMIDKKIFLGVMLLEIIELIKSPVIDGMPKSSITGNNVETKLNHM